MDAIACRRIVLKTLIEVDAARGILDFGSSMTEPARRLLAADGPCADCAARPVDALPTGTADPRCCDSVERRRARGELP